MQTIEKRARGLMGKIPHGAQIAANLTIIAKNAIDFVKNLFGLGMFGIP